MSNYLELIALVWFLICWLGYSEYSRRKANDRPCLSNTLDLYREDWMRVMLRRDNRISDASVVGNLERNGAFFASSCLLILASIITALGYTQEVMEVFSTMPFGTLPSREIWEMRMVVLMVIFIYAFFKFTWSMRMYNFVSVLIGSAPLTTDTLLLLRIGRGFLVYPPAGIHGCLYLDRHRSVPSGVPFYRAEGAARRQGVRGDAAKVGH